MPPHLEDVRQNLLFETELFLLARLVSLLQVVDLARPDTRQVTTRHLTIDALVFEEGDVQRAEEVAVRLVLSCEAMERAHPLGAWAIDLIATAFEWLAADAPEAPDAVPFGGLTPGAWPDGTAAQVRLLEQLAGSNRAAAEAAEAASSLAPVVAAFGAHLADVLGGDDGPSVDSCTQGRC